MSATIDLVIPDEWERRRLRFDASVNPVKSELDREEDIEVSFVPMEAVGEFGDLELTRSKLISDVYNGYTYFRDGDVCIAKITPCFENGKGALADGLLNGIAFGTTELHIIRPSSEVDKKFLFYLTIAHDFRHLGESEMLGAGGQKRVPERFLKDWLPPLPPLDTQKRIAAFLDEKTAQIDGLIAKKRELLERLAEKRQALITQAVTKGLNPNAPLKPSGIDWLGDIPAHWEVVLLNRLISMKSGDMISAKKINQDGRYPVFGGNGLRGYTDSFNTKNKIVLIGRQGAHCGNINITSEFAFVTEHALRCITNMPINLEWLAAVLEVMRLGDHSVSAAQPGLSVDRLNMLRTVCVSLNEKNGIALYITESLKQELAIKAQIQKSIDLLTEYRSALITAAVTGQIDLERGQIC